MSGFQMVLSGIESVPIVHCHIPRTGGMSVDYYFRNVFGDENCVRLGTEEDFIRIRDPNYPFHAFRWKYLSAHLPARDIMNVMGARKFFMFTIVPVSAIPSSVRFLPSRILSSIATPSMAAKFGRSTITWT